MNRININEASREELISLVKQLWKRDFDAAPIRELEGQVEELRQKLNEKEEMIKALTQQNIMLSKKSAEDEETISVLIGQLEGLSVKETDIVLENNVLGASAVLVETTPLNSKEKISGNIKGCKGPFDNSGSCVSVVTGSSTREPTRNPSSAAMNLKKNEELEKLEMKVRELTEVNKFYTAIVLQYDQEERLKKTEEHSSHREESNTAASMDVTSLSERIDILESERDVLRRMLFHQDQEKQILVRELQTLREELSNFELDLAAVERWKRAAVSSSKLAEYSTDVPTSFVVKDEELPTLRTVAEVIIPTQYKSGGGRKLVSNHTTLGNTTASLNETRRATHSTATRKSFPQLNTPPELSLCNPSGQESLLLQRVELYRSYIDEVRAYEEDRQRNFEEIERARAELFTDMNAKLEEQRREIQGLTEKLWVYSNARECSEAKTKLMPRSVNDAATSPIFVLCPLDECAEIQSHNRLSLLSLEAMQLDDVESFYELAAAEIQEECDHTRDDNKNENKKKIHESLGDLVVLEENTLVMPDKREDPAVVMEDESTDKLESFSKPKEANQIETLFSDSHVVHLERKLFEATEVINRLAISIDERDEIVQVLSQHSLITVAMVNSLTIQAVTAMDKANIIENTLNKMQTHVSFLEERERELMLEVSRFNEEILPVRASEEKNQKLLLLWSEIVSSSLDSVCMKEPMQSVFQAYSEVLDAQCALLRTISTPAALDFLDNDCEYIGKQLGVIVAKYNNLSDGNGKVNAEYISFFSDFSQKETNENAAVFVENTQLHNERPLLLSQPQTKNHTTSSSSLLVEDCCVEKSTVVSPCNIPSGEPPHDPNAFGVTVKTGQLLDKCPESHSISLGREENKTDKNVTQGASLTESQLFDTPTASFFLGDNLVSTSDKVRSPDARTSQENISVSLDYFVAPQRVCKKAESLGEAFQNVSSEKQSIKFFETVASANSRPTHKEETTRFVAEFDPFA